MQEAILDVLRAIRDNKSAGFLLAKGYRYSQIAAAMQEAIERGLLVQDAGMLNLTEAARTALREAITSNPAWGGAGWIKPRDEDRVEKVSEDVLYFPSVEATLSF